MPAANRVAGIAYVYVDGIVMPLGGTLTIEPWDSEKETVKGLSGVVGYKETPMEPFIEIEVILDPALDIKAFQEVRNSVITAELANGQVYVLKPAWSTTRPDMNTGEGTATLRFEGKSCVRTA